VYWSLTFKPSAWPFGLTGLADVFLRISAPPLVATNIGGIVSRYSRRLSQSNNCHATAPPENTGNAAHSVIYLQIAKRF
jgi:hypothetical protein